MKKKWAVFGIIITLMIGYCQVVAQADVGGSFSGGSSSRGSGGSRGGTTTYHSSSSSSAYGRRYGSQTSPIVLFIIAGLMARGFYDRPRNRRNLRKEGRIALAQLRDADPTFKERDLVNTVQEIFINVQEAWSAKDMSPVQKMETPELFRLHQSQLERYRQKQWTPHVKTKRITAVRLVSFSETTNEFSIVICLSARVVDYTLSRDGLVAKVKKERFIAEITAYALTARKKGIKVGVLTITANGWKTNLRAMIKKT